MKYFLIQFDGEENLIAKTEVDITDCDSVINSVLYYDIKYKPNRNEIEKWISSGQYKVDFLSISGEDDEEDGFSTYTMYLEIQIIS